jgi:hypothetical protein
MLLFAALLATWAALAHNVAAADTACVVKEELSGEDKPCKFPFTVANEVHNECVVDSQHAVDGAHHGEVVRHSMSKICYA